MICGIYPHVLDLVESTYTVSDFRSLGLPLYILCGLAKNAQLYQSSMSIQDQGHEDLTQQRLVRLAESYFPPETHPEEYNSIINLLLLGSTATE